MFTAVAMMGLNRLKHIDPRAIVVHFSATGLVFALASLVLFPVETPSAAFTWGHALELLGVGVTATLGQYCLTRAFTAGDPARVSVASLSQFVFILVLDVFVLGNPLDASKLWGVPLVLGPTLWLMTRRQRPLERMAGPAPELADGPLATPSTQPGWVIQAKPAVSSDAK
jgi:drug/metabolite transporter (DMT)-like permease